MAFLRIVRGTDTGRIWELAESENVIGRSSCEVRIRDKAVSRAHARLTGGLSGGRWVLEDLGSANGTRLNGRRLNGAAVVGGGDEIGVGNTCLRLEGTVQSAASRLVFDEEGSQVSAGIVEEFFVEEDTGQFTVPGARQEDAVDPRLLLELVSEVNSILNREVLLSRTLEWLFKILPADRGYVLTLDESGEPRPEASRFRKGRVDDTPVPRSIVREVLKKQVGLITANAITDERFGSRTSVANLGVRSAVCFPIKGRDKVQGLIYLDVDAGLHRYTTDELKLLTAIGCHMGLALENIQLHESTLQYERLAVVGETAAYLSHHIKNMLQALGAGVDVVQLCLESGDLSRAKRDWPMVQDNLRKINAIILNMLAFSKERRPLMQKVDVNELLQECVDLERPQMRARGIHLDADLGDLPSIDGDPTGLHQAFLNLVNNAMEAVDGGTGAISVASRFDEARAEITVAVRDNGAGIAKKQLRHIFKPFFSSKGHNGTGLGLAVANMMVQEHGGSIAVESAVGRGTTFTVTLPSRAIWDHTFTKGEP